jgi:hypothetical protein
MMLPLSTLTRRALVAATTAFVAVAPAVDARTKSPQAFAKVTLSDATANDVTTFGFTFKGGVAHPASGKSGDFSGSVFVGTDTSSTEARASLIKDLKGVASDTPANLGETVPADRIAAVLL